MPTPPPHTVSLFRPTPRLTPRPATGLVWLLLLLAGCASSTGLFDLSPAELTAQRQWLAAAVDQHDVNGIRERVLFGHETFSPLALDEALSRAAATGDVKLVEVLLQSGAPLNGNPARYPDATGVTALMSAALAGQSAVASYLLGRGARTDSADRNGLTPLHYATGAALLIEIVPEPRPDGWDTPQRKRLPQRERLTAILLKAGSKPDVRDVLGRTPLYYAAVAGSEELVGLLLAAGADPAIPDTSGNTPLAAARNASPPDDAVLKLLSTPSKPPKP